MKYVEKPSVIILMATYNGEKFLSLQIESIIKQTCTDWILIIRDDHSTDNTLSILKSYLSDSRIRIIEYGDDHGSACINFSNLVMWAKQYSADYVMFADQDDIWCCDKIEKSLAHMKTFEQNDTRLPLLCYSNFRFINDRGDHINKYLDIPGTLLFETLLVENYAWGCTMIMNKYLLDIITKIPYKAVNHDYWISLVCSAFGKSLLINDTLIDYRQHENNVSGNVSNSFWSNRIKRYTLKSDIMINHFSDNLSTIILFQQCYKEKLSVEKKKLVEKYILLYSSSGLRLVYFMLKKSILKSGFFKNMIMLPFILFLRDSIWQATKDRLNGSEFGL